MKMAVFKYNTSYNIGDDIQSLAVSQHVKNVDIFIDRDTMNTYDGEECVVVMNGWFSDKVQNWPPSEAIRPIFFGFHMTPAAMAAYKQHVGYFKKHEPIGCRDPETARVLKEWGVDAYVSSCATLTFPRRTTEPEQGLDLLIDVKKKKFCRHDRHRVLQLSHVVANVDHHAKHSYAQGLLDFYRTRAKRIVTSRIHCAMPCAAMGIPVVYIGIQEYRTDVLGTIGIKYTRKKLISKMNIENLEFFSKEFESTKGKIRDDLKSKLQSNGVELAGS